MSSRKFILSIAREQPLLIVATVVFSLASAIFNGVGTALIIPILIVFLGEKNTLEFPGQPPLLNKFFALFDRFEDQEKLIVMIVVVVMTIILKNVTNFISSLIGNYSAKNLVRNMRTSGLRILLDVDLDFYSKIRIGDIVNRINGEIEKTASAIRTVIRILITVLTILTFVYLLILISWRLTLLTTVLLSLIALSNQYFVIKSKELGQILAEKSREYSRKIIEILTGIRLVKSVSNEEAEYQQIEELILAREDAQLKSQAISSIIGPINEILGIIIILFLVGLGRYLFTQQLEEFAPILLTYLVILFRLLPFIGQLNNARTQFANSIHSIDIVEDFLRKDNKPFQTRGIKPFERLIEGIQFEGVDFAYPDHEKLVLKQLSLWIPKGKTIALVGSSGAGKSTIADLLPRFYDPTAGRITIDGIDLKDYEIKSFRRNMGIVSQDTFLFNHTIRYNIAYGLEHISEEEIITAARRANAHEFILQLPQGLDTEVGDRGVMLSGGQRQRIAIARALLRNPDILILDEATSALDTVSERLVQEAIDELCRDRTTLVIAHRLSTVQKAHQIVVLDGGQVVEIGNHEELLAANKYYAHLYQMQFRDKEHKNSSLITEDISTRLSSENFNDISHQMRTNLHSMLGSLRLVIDHLVDNQEEREKLIEESYQSGLTILKRLEYFESASISSK
ncbi:Xenobiotic-transporting ATPase [Stanieria cyanosphaera PCC 7437]|uniref:Xenobiotic-transporting ATPase n=1 Tax=Stanieria cyanosphaera (strain ATCC 29371 / PCC 7437) TaxID=111780 RepID=K9XVK7_STAC7|nr:ATP-binding cassette domain-containing protein [Stanieria cyanosphaera]AFZ36630.1 Xenobiotic-transporting ATPase [Stanieria cyanosphaera PCC 7437]